MKTLFLTRHAKSSWSDASLHDRDRPLNKRGLRDAPRMGQWLAQHPLQPAVMVSSPAVRAWTTAELIAQELGFSTADIVTRPQIYEATPATLITLIQHFDDDAVTSVDRIMMVGHNPGTTDLLNLIEGVRIDNVPTCGLAIIQFEVETWKAIAMADATLVRFQYPKQLGQ